MIVVKDIDQNSAEWLTLKAGVPSSSSFDKIVTPKGVRSKSAEKYLFQLAGEKIIGSRPEGYQSGAMSRGIEMEGAGVSYYELIAGVDTEKVTVCYLNKDKKFLTSPDRIILKDGKHDGLLEMKCPQINTQVSYLLDPSSLEKTYFQQVQGQMYVTELPYCVLMSYFPGLQPVILRIERDEEFINKLSTALDKFCVELADLVEVLKNK